jgi:hypothetical protein
VEINVMDKEVITITIDEIMADNNHIMVMVLVINAVAEAEEETMVEINNVVEIQRITEIPIDECKPIRSITK